MIDAIANFRYGIKPSSMHELRTLILKKEVNDINIRRTQKKLGSNMNVQLCQIVGHMERVGVL